MKHWIASLLVLAWSVAHATTLPAISLEPPTGQTQLNQTTLQVIQGQCGQTAVKLVGVVDVLNGVYMAATDESRLTLSLGNCSGTVCEGQMSFFVFDPVTLKRIVTGKGNDSCNAACASKLMGGDKLPFQVVN